MKKHFQLNKWLVWLALFAAIPGFGQTPAGAVSGRSFSLREAVEFAVRENVNVRNTQLDGLSAEARIREIKAVAMPQVSVAGAFQYNPIIQQIVIPAGSFGPPASGTAQGGSSDAVSTIKLSTNFVSNAALTVNQLLFDASYKIGLKAAATLRELSQKNTAASKIAVAEQVSKAYYSVLVSQERAKLLDSNIGRLDTTLRETRELNRQGFVEKIDVQRLEVQANNLRTERQNVQNLIGLSYYLLKFQMGLTISDDIILTDDVKSINTNSLEQALTAPAATAFDYNSRIEYSQLQSQLQLADYDLQSTAAAYYPRAVAFANYGYNNGRNDFLDILSKKWFNSSAIGLQVSVPLFDGFAKRYKSQQQRFTLQKAQNSGILLKNSIDLQIQQAKITTQNSLQSLRTQQRNMDLAQEILRVTRIKYKEGVGSNIEVLNAESSSREAQTNYFAALLDLMLAKVDLDKASGVLYKE
jgi:outer membrane protein TolC